MAAGQLKKMEKIYQTRHYCGGLWIVGLGSTKAVIFSE